MYSYITLRLTVYISQLINYAQAYSLYFTTHTLRSGLQFIYHNSYITLRLTVYISQLIHHGQAYSLYFTTHTLQCMSCEIQTVSLIVMYEL
jgi:NADH:ubiquinone oxidoreductase subunit B-like Fe-S oxidoreductase